MDDIYEDKYPKERTQECITGFILILTTKYSLANKSAAHLRDVVRMGDTGAWIPAEFANGCWAPVLIRAQY